MTDLDVAGRRCLSFTVSGDWAHFRRIDTTTGKRTYHVIPRTTATGLLAAVLGRQRDSYYDLFGPDVSAMAIEPAPDGGRLRTYDIPMLTLPTTAGDIKQAANTSGKTIIDPDEIEDNRKRRTFEYIVDPVYRIHLVLEDQEGLTKLETRLSEGRSTYTPYLGKSECLASFHDVTWNQIEPLSDVTAIDSVVPESGFTPSPGAPFEMERTPAYMERDGDHRRTTGFVSYAYTRDGSHVQVAGVDAMQVGGSTVQFM